MPRRTIATRDQQIPTPTVGAFTTITYAVTEHSGAYTLAVTGESGATVVLYSSLDKAHVLSMGELVEGQGL